MMVCSPKARAMRNVAGRRPPNGGRKSVAVDAGGVENRLLRLLQLAAHLSGRAKIRLGWSQVWLPMACPASTSARAISGLCCTNCPMRKNVAFTPWRSSTSIMRQV